jgi:glutamate 5-kinase
MVITNGEDVTNINDIFEGKDTGTLFAANKADNFNIMDYITSRQYQKAETSGKQEEKDSEIPE